MPDSTSDFDMGRELLKILPTLKANAYRLTRNTQAIDDLVQDTIEQCLKSQHSFQVGSNLKGWACFVMRNKLFSQYRRTKRIVPMAEGEAERIPLFPNQHWKMELDEVYKAIEFLPADMKAAFELVVMEEKPYEEAALLLDEHIGTIKSKVARARNLLELYFGVSHKGKEGRQYGN